MDEPTSSLSPKEANLLFANIRKLKATGVSTIFISHHMDEIFSVADKVTVLRDGGMVGSWDIAELTEETLVHHMVGRKINEMFPKLEILPGKEVLRVENVTVPGKVTEVSFSVGAGEILGIGGLVGAGRSELRKGDLRSDTLQSMRCLPRRAENPDTKARGTPCVKESCLSRRTAGSRVA